MNMNNTTHPKVGSVLTVISVLLVQLSQMNNTTNPKVRYSRSCLYDARNPLSRFTKVVVRGANDPCPSEDASSDTGAT